MTYLARLFRAGPFNFEHWRVGAALMVATTHLCAAPELRAQPGSPASNEGAPVESVAAASVAPPELAAVNAPSKPCVILDNQSPDVPNAAFLSAIGDRFGGGAAPTCDPNTSPQRRVSIVYSPANRELTITFNDVTRGGAVTRVLQAPDNPSEAPDAAALVALELSHRDAPEAPTSSHAAPAAPPPFTPTTVTPTTVAPPAAPIASAPVAAAREQPPQPRPRRFATAAFVYPLATNYDQPDVHTSLDFNLIYGVVGEVQGLQLGMFNDVRGPVQGLQLGLFLNGAAESLRGASIAGAMSSVGRVNAGLQAAGLLTMSAGTTDGIQASFLGNLTRGSLRGAQFAGLMNVSGGESKGLQVSFVTNIAKHLRGGQFSMLGNYAENVTGLQVGLVNIGGRVRGTQIGLVNIAKEVEGMPIGLVSVSKTGGVHLNAWASNTNLGNVGLRLGTRHTYSMFTLGYDREDGADLVGPGFIIGVRAPVTPKFAVDMDVGGDYLLGTRLCCFESTQQERRAHLKDRSHFRLRVLPTWQPSPHFSIFAGGGLAVRIPFAVYSNFLEVDRTITLGPEVLLGVSI